VSEALQDPVLEIVRVLVLVDEHVIEARRLREARFRKFREERFGVEQEVVEVHRAARLEALLVTVVGESRELVLVLLRAVLGFAWRKSPILPAADRREQIARAELVVPDAHVAQGVSRERLLVTAVVDRELLRVTEQ